MIPQTYEEASCTAMFAYGFARGVRFGWFKDPKFTLQLPSGLGRDLSAKPLIVKGMCMACVADHDMRLRQSIMIRTCVPLPMTITE